MNSPFPGMDPFLEHPEYFPDFHDSLIYCVKSALNAVLPEPFYAIGSTRVYLEASERRMEPDVDVLNKSNLHPRGIENGDIAVAEVPGTALLTVHAPLIEESVEEQFLEIHSKHGGHPLVTSIEVLSTANKLSAGNGRTEYLRKQREMRKGNVNLVEIDLLRGGVHTTAVPLRRLKEQAVEFDYHVCIQQCSRPDDYFVAPIRLENPLPVVPIPLTGEFAPVIVDLQAVFRRAYAEVNYGKFVNYARREFQPPLSTERLKWIDGILQTTKASQPL